MQHYSQEEFGRIYEVNEGGITNFESAILKFGLQRNFQTIIDHLPPANEVIQGNHLYPFMAAASLPNGALSMIYHLVRQAPELMKRH